MKSNSRSYPASFRALTIPNNRHIISLIISISVSLYALYGLRGSVGVLRVHRCKYSHVISFNLCALKFCNHARTRSARKTPGKVRPDSIAGAWRKIREPKQAQRYIRYLCNMPAICKRSAQKISTRPDRPRNRSPKIIQPAKIRKTGIEIVKS